MAHLAPTFLPQQSWTKTSTTIPSVPTFIPAQPRSQNPSMIPPPPQALPYPSLNHPRQRDQSLAMGWTPWSESQPPRPRSQPPPSALQPQYPPPVPRIPPRPTVPFHYSTGPVATTAESVTNWCTRLKNLAEPMNKKITPEVTCVDSRRDGRIWTVKYSLGGVEYGKYSDSSKKHAKQKAAKLAYLSLGEELEERRRYNQFQARY
ncbi:hypothetical protein DL96DRAFT_1725529 [Flagelloscypha sp. PMI_526]|nr:hypothetical protein DL96DRAFT_1725529 [Flagelloscypha sp. PMI_526]